MNEARAQAWRTRRLKYGPGGNRGTYTRCSPMHDAVRLRRQLARLVAVVHAHDLLTEGQLARVMRTYRLDVRELEDYGREELLAAPIDGEWGQHAMRSIT